MNQWLNDSESHRINSLFRFHPQKCSDACLFLCETELSLQSAAHFGDLIFKSALNANVFGQFEVQTSSGYSAVRFLLTTFLDRGAKTRNKHQSEKYWNMIDKCCFVYLYTKHESLKHIESSENRYF